MNPDDVASRRAAREARARGGLPPIPPAATDSAQAAGRAITAGQVPIGPVPRVRRARRATTPDEFTTELLTRPPVLPDGVGTRPLNVQIPADLAGQLGAYCTQTGRSRREVVHALLLQLLGPLEGTVGGQP